MMDSVIEALDRLVQLPLISSFLDQSYFPPSTYSWLLPHPPEDFPMNAIDDMAKQGLFPSIRDLFPAVILTFFFGIARLALTFLFFKPFSIAAMNIHIIEQGNDKGIDEFYKRAKSLSKKAGSGGGISASAIKEYCTTRDDKLSASAVEKYIFNLRKNEASAKKIVKFVEALWRLIFYGYFCYVGARVLLFPTVASWIGSTEQHWVGWPVQEITKPMNFYYQAQLACYLHQLLWTEVSRSDAAQMILHHVTTILLIFMSYLTLFTRIGTSILLVHDSADIFLESAKCFNYCKKGRAGATWPSACCDTLFGIFAVVFFVSRLLIYPRYLVYSLVVEAPAMMGGRWLGYYAYASLLITLQLLHIFWFYLIARMIYRLVTTGIEKDERSDDEEDFAEDYETDAKTKKAGSKKKR